MSRKDANRSANSKIGLSFGVVSNGSTNTEHEVPPAVPLLYGWCCVGVVTHPSLLGLREVGVLEVLVYRRFSLGPNPGGGLASVVSVVLVVVWVILSLP